LQHIDIILSKAPMVMHRPRLHDW